MPRKHPTKRCDDCGIPVSYFNPTPKRCQKCAEKFRIIPPEIRFLRNVRKTPTCWLWTAGKHHGYGFFYTLQHRCHGAHRFSWELHNGVIPEGMHVLHHCDNPPCVNPEHLYIGTDADNRSDMIERGRIPRGEKSYQHKLTSKQVIEIREKCSLGMRQSEIAHIYGVSRTAVEAIHLKRTWKHVIPHGTL